MEWENYLGSYNFGGRRPVDWNGKGACGRGMKAVRVQLEDGEVGQAHLFYLALLTASTGYVIMLMLVRKTDPSEVDGQSIYLPRKYL